jgi:hypothetical protein
MRFGSLGRDRSTHRGHPDHPGVRRRVRDKPDTTVGTMNADVLAEKRPGVGANRIAQDVESPDLSRVSGTPTFFINRRRHHGAYDVDHLSRAVRAAGARAKLVAS